MSKGYGAPKHLIVEASTWGKQSEGLLEARHGAITSEALAAISWPDNSDIRSSKD
jgi:hypothetical protein